MADGAAIAPASPPPTPHGVDFSRAAYNKCPADYSSLQAPLCPTHPVRPPPRGRAPNRLGANNKCPAYYSPLQAPALLGSSKAGAVADGAAIAPASPPPTPHGVDFFSNTNEILKVVGGGGGYNWVQTIISIYDAVNPGLLALEPLHHKLRGEV